MRDSRPWVEDDHDDVSDDVIKFFLFLFLIFFVTFDLGLQIKSNKFVNFFKIPISQLRHLGSKIITFQNLIF